MGEPILEMRNITKDFPGVRAIDHVSFAVNSGEVHALVGANGAGKSTLMKVLGGVYSDYEGEIVICGKRSKISSPRDAARLGVALIHQEFCLVPTLTVAENIMLGMEPRRQRSGGVTTRFIDWERLYADSEALLRELGFNNVPTHRVVADLGVAEQQLVQIAKAMAAKARIIVMDEPTARLSRAERDELFKIIRRLRIGGTSIIYISHFLEEVFCVADRVTVMRDGRVVTTQDASSLTRKDLIRLMLGRDIETGAKIKAGQAKMVGPGEEVLRVEHLTRPGKFEDVSFHVRRGEIVGVAGLVGSGRTELARAIFGADGRGGRGAYGRILMKGQAFAPSSPKDAVARGIALLPEDRKQQGLILVRPVSDNILFAVCNKLRRWLFLDHPRRTKVAADMVRRLSIKCPSLSVPVATLSGGNQQKVVLAKWLAAGLDVLILDQPTAGVDVGTKEEIYQFLRDLAGNGAALVMISDDPEELSRVCDRILVMHRGRIVKELLGTSTSQDVLSAVTANY